MIYTAPLLSVVVTSSPFHPPLITSKYSSIQSISCSLLMPFNDDADDDDDDDSRAVIPL